MGKIKIEGCLTFVVIILMTALSIIIAIATVEGFVYMFSKCTRAQDTVYVKHVYGDTAASNIKFEDEWAREFEKYE